MGVCVLPHIYVKLQRYVYLCVSEDIITIMYTTVYTIMYATMYFVHISEYCIDMNGKSITSTCMCICVETKNSTSLSFILPNWIYDTVHAASI